MNPLPHHDEPFQLRCDPPRKRRMRNMSFALTTDAVRQRTKTVTRRLAWHTLKPGDRVAAVRQCMGLARGEKVERLATIRILANDSEPLAAILDRPDDPRLEGFPELSPQDFVTMFATKMRCTPETVVQRIEFEYLD